MKIAMLMPTRGKPHIAAAIVNAGHFLASGEHEITWVLGIDLDDDYSHLEKRETFGDLSANVFLAAGERERSLGMIFNRCAKVAPEDTDIYCQFVDDGVISSVDWDKIMVDNLNQLPLELGVISWQATDNPRNMGNPCFTRQWYERAGFYTEHFPFWWDDTWLSEKWSFVTGQFVPIIPELKIVCRKSVTRRMRDLRFWVEFFAATRRDRLEEARVIREGLSLPLSGNVGWLIEQWQARDRQMLINVPGLEATLGVAGDNDASPLYLEARSRALAHIAGTDTGQRWTNFFLSADSGIEVITSKPVAVDSPDHLHPLGTRQDNSKHHGFNLRLRGLFGAVRSKLSVLDLGCAGGGMVASFLEEGDFAVGIEGSDYSKARARAEWGTYPGNLFTADITELFEVRREGVPILFDAVTMWEVAEHIPEAKLPEVMRNIDRHLRPGGIVVMSISTGDDVYDGVSMHQTVHPEAWWREFFDKSGWAMQDDLVNWFGDQVVRGPPGCPHSFIAVLRRA